MNTTQHITKNQLLGLLNMNLKKHPDYEEGMSFDDINITPLNTYEVKSNFDFGGKAIADNYAEKCHVYDEVFSSFLK